MHKAIENEHNSGIDALRGISILAVILLHINIRIPFSSTFLGSIMPKMMYKALFWSGHYGVCIFFVVSGFLITTSALNKWKLLSQLPLRGFYSLRFARIMPLLLLLLCILSILHTVGVPDFIINPQRSSLGEALFAALTFHINWLEITKGYLPGSWDVLWSLSIEEVFYLFFPLLCIVTRKEWLFIVVLSSFLCISPFARTSWFLGYGFAAPDTNHFAYLDALALGCIAAIISRRRLFTASAQNTMAVIGWAFVALIMVFRSVAKDVHLLDTGLNVTVLAIGIALILIRMQQRFEDGQQVASKFSWALRFLGRNSYEVYLSHMFVVLLLVQAYKALNLSGEWAWLLYSAIIAISAILGELVARYFSNPMNRWLRGRLQRFIRPNTTEGETTPLS